MGDEDNLGHLVSSQPQITLSQYEYRVSRLPTRRHARRRRWQKQATSDQDSDEVTAAVASSSSKFGTTSAVDNEAAELSANKLSNIGLANQSETEPVEHDELSNATPAHQPDTELIEHDDHSPMQHTTTEQIQDGYHSLPPADTIHECHSNSNNDNAFTAPTAHMFLDDDANDQALLRDADACDSDVPTTDPDDEEDEQDSNYVLPISTQEDDSAGHSKKRKVLSNVDANPTESPARKKSSRTRKKSNQTLVFEAVLSSHQLIMVPNGSAESGSFHEDPCSSPDEDAIEDSQMHLRRPLWRTSTTTRTSVKTVAAKVLRQRVKTFSSVLWNSDHFAKPISSRQQAPLRQKKSISDLGDGFDAAERNIITPRLSLRKSGVERLETTFVATTGLQLEPSPERVPPRSQTYDGDDGMQALPVDEVEDFEEHHRPAKAATPAMSAQDPILRIANMTDVMRKANLSGGSRAKSQNVIPRSRKQRKSKSGRDSTQSLELALNNETERADMRIEVEQSCRASMKPMPPQKTPSQRLRPFIPGDAFDTYERNSRAFASLGSAHANKPQASTTSHIHTLSHPGNFAAVSQLVEEVDEQIEDDGPSILRRQHVSVGILQMKRPQYIAVTPRTAQAAYPTPRTTIGTSGRHPVLDQTPSRLILPAQVSRARHDNLAEQMIEEDLKEINDASFGYPVAAAYPSPARDNPTQLDQSSMRLDDAELSWDSSTHPTSLGTNPPVNIRHRIKPLMELAREVSRNFGTISPEKSAVRRTTSHLLTSKAPFRRQDGASRLARAG